MRFLRSLSFWLPFTITLCAAGTLFLWELNLLPLLPAPVRPPATEWELVFTGLLVLLIAFNAGLVAWRSQMGTCPVGVKRATGLGGTIGFVALFCPVCLVLPASVLGLGALLAMLTPFLPLLRIIALVILGGALFLLWPKDEKIGK